MFLSRLVVWMNKSVKTIYYFFKSDKIFFCTNNFPCGVNFPKPMGNLFSSILDSHNKTCLL